MTTQKILVLGGTGKTGRKVVQGLENLGHQVRIGSRNANPAFDWDKPENWGAVLDGIESMYITFQPDLAVPGAFEAIQELVRQAKVHKVQKLVLLSGKGEREAERCETVVKRSGLNWTIVRASWFNQNFSESFFLEPLLAGQMAVPMGDTKIPFIDTDDIAAVAVEALVKEIHNGKTYELTGPEFLSFREATHRIARATGRDIQFHDISQESYTRMLKELKVPDSYIWLINYLFTEVLGNPANAVITNDVERVLGRKAKRFDEYIADHLKSGVWNISKSQQENIVF